MSAILEQVSSFVGVGVMLGLEEINSFIARAIGPDARFIFITPEMANELLKRNIDNRRIRPNRVLEYFNSIKSGGWITTHQGIAFTKAGILVDGQHRLTAIAKSGIGMLVLVTVGLDEGARLGIDQAPKRTYADTLGVDRFILGPVVELARLRFARSNPESSQVKEMTKIFQPLSERLHGGVKIRPLRFLGSNPVKAAAILRIASGESEEYVHGLYESLQEIKPETLPPIGQSFLRQVLDGATAGAAASKVNFARAWIVFAKENANLTKILIKDLSSRIREIKDVISIVMETSSRKIH